VGEGPGLGFVTRTRWRGELGRTLVPVPAPAPEVPGGEPGGEGALHGSKETGPEVVSESVLGCDQPAASRACTVSHLGSDSR
jgi:hypothetical protein